MSERDLLRKQSRMVSTLRSKETSIYEYKNLEDNENEILFHAGKKLEVEVPKHKVI